MNISRIFLKINLINIFLTEFSSSKNNEINKQNSGITNRIHAESSLRIIEILGISFTIAGVIWGISYAILIELEHPTAMRDSLIVFSLILLPSLFVLARKK